MAINAEGAFINYYEILNIAENAPIMDIKAALARYRSDLEVKINNPLSMNAARSAMNEIVPAIERILLDANARVAYDQQLAANRQKQDADYEPEDDEGLDDSLRVPFLFNPFENFDTEIPAFTLREIAMKLNDEWSEACSWINDTSNETHFFVSYLTFANRKRLAERIGHIIEAVSPHQKRRMDTNEAIERCIDVLDPRTERPRVGIHNRTFDGIVFDAGSFISDAPARAELILAHEGVRGCAFGSLESHTDWLSFEHGCTSVPFRLMPQGMASLGVSEVDIIPIYFKVSKLLRNADHTAQLVLRMENQVRTIEQVIPVVIHVQPLPPRVGFEPALPVQAGSVVRGTPVQVIVMPRNYGDEQLIPLAARIGADEAGVTVRPSEIRTNQPITISIDTSNRPFGKPYTIPLNISYTTAGSRGPTILPVQGEILPTIWQSMVREKPLGNRLGTGVLVGFAGWLLFAVFCAGLASHSFIGFLLLLLIPVSLLIAIRPFMATTIAHAHRAGNKNADIKNIAAWKLWGIPLLIGVVIALLGTFLLDVSVAVFLVTTAGFILGAILGFVVDKARSQDASVAHEIL